jgi:WD40-like Beta Propeller Repeat
MRTRTRRDLAGCLVGAVTALIVLATVATTHAQTPFVPYYGKNSQIRYDNFRWHIYTTDHFEIYYYPETEKQLERVAGYAESAYQQISADLKHDLAFKVSLIVFKTSSEFQEQNVIPGAAQEGVGAFAEPFRDRMVLPLDEPPDLLYRLIVHELTHIFEFDIIPQGLIRRSVPLWVNEGLSDYMTGIWRPLDLMTVRDAAVADIVPKMSDLEGYGGFNNPRLIYNLGHTVFEFIESKWGKEGLRQFLFALRKSVIGGGEDAYEEAFKVKPDEFDQEFEKYLKDRFKPFRDKERPADYGRDLAPNPQKTRYTSVLSVEPSPSGDLIAAMVGNRRDQELDVVLLSSKDGTVVRNLTSGFDQSMGFAYIALPGGRWNSVAWMSWSPNGDRIAYFVRTEKERALIVQNVVSGKIERRIPMKTVDEPESPAIAPDGRHVAFAGLRGAIGDLFMLDLETGQIDNLTNDPFADYGPTFSPDGSYLVYMTRISGNEKLFRLDVATKKKTQLTFGTHDDAQARFVDDHTLVFPSTAVNPTLPIEPEVARNGNIFNIWTLDMKTGELRQYTDAVGGNLSPIVLNGDKTSRIAFVTYFKGAYGLHTLERKDPLQTALVSDFGEAGGGPPVDFQAPLTHTLVAENKRKKGAFEKLFMDGRPPVNVGITSGGDIYGGTQISFTDVLGDKQINFYAASISQYRTLAGSYVNLSRRFNYALQGFSQTDFFYGQLGGVFYDPALSPFIDRNLAIATRTIQGGSVVGIWPFDRYRRIEVSGGIVNYSEQFSDSGLQQFSQDYQTQQFGQPLFNNGTLVPLGVAYVSETTVFREFGPLAGSTMRLGYEAAPKIGSTLSRQTLDLDLRHYLRLFGSGLLAVRARGFKSWGDAPDFNYFGGNADLRGYEYLQFIGNNTFYGNAELRFPLVEAMLTPIGVVGGIRGVFFAGAGGAFFNSQPFQFWSRNTQTYVPVVNYNVDQATGDITPIYGDPIDVGGFRLVDGRASYGFGLETFALGFPIHFDWAWRTLFNRNWEDIVFASQGGSTDFRRPQFKVWVGYDF